ncbi:UDP-N-acetylglucosamine--N-acetylmuramyl-(pentapeptide) pyrophosphoryl-undecaprenol N-acetylglucosamine transferase [Herbiconiux sp. KACC 21604]|uniref:UDP-N-acetylglucosamine--N-acetylmuramyl- (pentapeptide) pyrophosphoryl-undecaprenol N-acetylglucosamine transferase n=1 Tax=unclassified Herbiconiux TaxID=2618217 RepID=UPI001490D502|nr:UDP-N-acetylglucosamine--N-acetylmuramyl-(pentapeptide) pyrophosphoryl-undecaprenol N-acetylglucosamine transferase [Herbiconiux sp. SALV-R1]QJU53332.1 UDP-N-acetylglucosamine--N-acetylmuramyl-(pentapeptide) pyrophosphoryl-undecaprenol N-acetylglucosamine transferase [Herbiconiux sp. SALV-R1]WPO88291.1 UDP-N-acetylglucosamine--N-acetylmuramyl-(pentapeptide) pyrophosphoryl-undecaprenol N-acetylglucosamine transferase [Herbiconiux sp. KACC 21604]
MTTYLLAGGGTAGHVNPLLATADRLREIDPSARVIVLGTAEGLEARLVPERGYELVTIPKLPFPRRPNGAALRFPAALRRTIAQVASLIRERGVEVVVGFGGYASAPGYLGARRAGVPFVIHEGNAKPGLANRLGARYSSFVGVTFAATTLPHSTLVGMPLRAEVTALADAGVRAEAATEAARFFGLDPARPTLLVTGGSLGARRINGTVHASAQKLVDAGWNVLHIAGDKAEVDDPGLPGYVFVNYCDRMELALAVADFAVSRAGGSTVSELAVVGIPSVLIPYPVGNGEQRFNALDLVNAGGAVLVPDAEFTPAWLDRELLPLLADRSRVATMAARSLEVGIPDASTRLAALVQRAWGGTPSGGA